MKKALSVFMAMMMLPLLYIPAFSSENILEPIVLDEGSPSDSGYISVSEPENEAEKCNVIFDEFSIQKASQDTLPEAYDSRDYGLVTPVKNQGDSGCCWAFGTINALESDAIAKGYYTAETADFSEAHLTWFTYTVINDTSNPNNGEGGNLNGTSPYSYGGNWQRAASSLSQGIGIANESEFPFYPYSLSQMGNYDESERYDHSSGLVVDNVVRLKNQDDIKQWLMEHGSCTAAIYYKNTYYNSTNGAYYYPSVSSTNHLISVIGWDDNFSASNFLSSNTPVEDGAWLIKDSWGTNSRINGYFWISYEDASMKDFTGFEVRPADDFYNVYTHNACYSSSYLPIPSNGRVANVYKARSYELIKSVAFTTSTPAVTATVMVYKNLPSNYSSPASGTLALTYTETLERAGYNCIDLPSTVDIDKNTYFSVLIKVSTADSSKINIPLEYSKSNSDTQYVFTSKESYYSTSATGSWNDVNSSGYGALYLNALTQCNHQSVTDEKTADCGNEGYSISVCSQCNKTISESHYPVTGEHQYGDWSILQETGDSNYKERHRTCSVCGNIETETVMQGSNFVTLSEFLNLIFERLINFFILIFNT